MHYLTALRLVFTYRKFFKRRVKKQLDGIKENRPPDRFDPNRLTRETDNLYSVEELRGFSFDPGLDPYSLDRPPDDLHFEVELN